MRTSFAMMASRVTPPVEEGVEVDGPEETGGVAVLICGYFGESWALLCLTVTTLIEHITVKQGDLG